MNRLYIIPILSMLIFGCQATTENVNKSREPNVIIEFDSAQSHFNNIEGLKPIVKGKKALLVINASKGNVDTVKSRAENIVKLMSEYSDLYVSYRYSVHSEDLDYVEVFIVEKDILLKDVLTQVNAQTLDESLGLFFSEDKVRNFEQEISYLKLTVEKETSIAIQLNKLVNRLGWDLASYPEFRGENEQFIPSLAFEMSLVVGDEKQLTKSEIVEVVEQWLGIYIKDDSSYGVAVNSTDKTVVVYK